MILLVEQSDASYEGAMVMRFGGPAIAVVTLALVLAAPAMAQTCGDNAVQGDETCDDGNAVGGDGCAANCTAERRRAFAVVGESSVNAQGRLGQAYGSPGLPLSGSLSLTIGGTRASDSSGAVPFVVLASDAQIDPVALQAPACFCARPTVPEGFPAGVVAQGTLGCGAGGLAEVDYQLSQDHDIIDVDPQCSSGTLQTDGHCTGPLQRSFTGGGGRGAATVEMGFTFYELSNCDGTPTDPDQQGCTADDPVSVPTQRLLLTTGTAVGEIIDADGTDATIAPGQVCGSVECDTSRAGALFDCDALLAEPPGMNAAALGGVDVAAHLSTLDDLVTVLRLPLVFPIPPDTPTPSATPVSTETPTGAPTESPTAPPTESPTVDSGGCAGDCDDNGTVAINEHVRGVSIALGMQPLSACVVLDTSGDGRVSIDELIRAVNAALNGCV
jgi:cysteine-rich repeat protein